MKRQDQIEVMLKTYETKRNNLLKRLYLPPYEDEKQNYLNQINKLEIQIKALRWVLGVEKQPRITKLQEVMSSIKNLLIK